MFIQLYSALLQIPGLEGSDASTSEQLSQLWADTGFMRWPLAGCLVLGIVVIILKMISLQVKAAKTRSILKDVDELLTQQQIR